MRWLILFIFTLSLSIPMNAQKKDLMQDFQSEYTVSLQDLYRIPKRRAQYWFFMSVDTFSVKEGSKPISKDELGFSLYYDQASKPILEEFTTRSVTKKTSMLEFLETLNQDKAYTIRADRIGNFVIFNEDQSFVWYSDGTSPTCILGPAGRGNRTY